MEGGTPTFALRDIPLAGHFINFSLCLSVARIDTPPLQPAALAFVSYGFVLVRVRVQFGSPSVSKAGLGRGPAVYGLTNKVLPKILASELIRPKIFSTKCTTEFLGELT